jgi:hypothetical protein
VHSENPQFDEGARTVREDNHKVRSVSSKMQLLRNVIKFSQLDILTYQAAEITMLPQTTVAPRIFFVISVDINFRSIALGFPLGVGPHTNNVMRVSSIASGSLAPKSLITSRAGWAL